jgi:hypothetical protein
VSAPLSVREAPDTTASKDAGVDEPRYDGSAPTNAAQHAGDRYAVALAHFFQERMPKPSRFACVTFQIRIDRTMHVWHVGRAPVQPSGDDTFDAAVRGIFEKLVDEKTALPDPPLEVAERYRGRTVNVRIGDDTCR